MTGFDKIVAAVKGMPKFGKYVKLSPDECTIKSLSEKMGVSVSIAGNRLRRLEEMGKVKSRKEKTTIIYKWIG